MMNKTELNYLEFPDIEQQSQYLADQVASILTLKINTAGKALLAVSGGSTPKTLFNLLSNAPLEWSKVSITLVDDRWLSASHQDSNQRLVEENLLINNAKAATLIPLYQPQQTSDNAAIALNALFCEQNLTIDIALLGMGNDGHSASIFPCCEQLDEGLNTKATFLATQPTSAPYSRITLSADAINKAEHIFVQLKGDDKKITLEKALANNDEKAMPIRRFLNKNTTVLWCP
ncbi:6-phosphogluconolactonase [Gammaproteobacteria bacterium AS21]